MSGYDWKTLSLKDLAAIVSERFRLEGIGLILVGGACVPIYSGSHIPLRVFLNGCVCRG